MENQTNCKRKYDQIRDLKAHREYEREYRKKKKREKLSNIERENKPQLEVEACM